MTERNTVSTERVPASGRTAPGSATKAARRAGGGERRGFAPGHELEDWCEAEAAIDRQLDCG